MSAEKKKKSLNQTGLYIALKLIAIRQNGKPFTDYLKEIKIGSLVRI